METTSQNPTNPRPRVFVALASALSLTGLALLTPGAALAAQGDNDIVISIIDEVTPSVVTIRTPAGAFGELGELLPEDIELPEDTELPEDFEVPEDLGDLQELLPEGFMLPEEFGFGGTGSGVIIGANGLIITNGHVVGNAGDVIVILDDGTVLDGIVTGVDTLTDFAFVEVEAATELPAVTLGDSSLTKVGQTAISIGNPLGRFPGSAAVGIISGLDRSINVYGRSLGGSRLNHLIQTDAAINSGNSGGALFDGDGQLIGITTAEAGLNDGIGFALPIDLAKPIIRQAQAGEAISRPYVGVIYTAIDALLAEEESLPVTVGALIGGGSNEEPVVAGGPADEAGLQAGDIITAVDGLAVDRSNPLDLQVLRFAPGDEILLDVLRAGESLELSATLGTRPADLAG
jgi:S1-C subfamily serine protease